MMADAGYNPICRKCWGVGVCNDVQDGWAIASDTSYTCERCKGTGLAAIEAGAHREGEGRTL